jgi:hypothetical protein
MRNIPRRTKYSFKKADWGKFNEVFKNVLKKWPSKRSGATAIQQCDWVERDGENDVHQRYERFQSGLDQASATAIPRGCRFDPVPFWCEEIDKLILIRDQRRFDAHESEEQRVEWISACRDVVNLINEKREECWKEFASTLRYGVPLEPLLSAAPTSRYECYPPLGPFPF